MFIGARLGGPEGGGGGSFARGAEGYERKDVGMGISPHGGSFGQPGVIYRGLCSMVERGSRGGMSLALSLSLSISLRELCEGNLEGGLPCWGP